MRALTKIFIPVAWVVVAATASAIPQYQIFDIGVVQVGDTASQGFGASPGGIAVGRSFQSNGTQAFSWTLGGGLVGLPNLAGRAYCRSDSANDSGLVVGTASTTPFGSSRLPVVWTNGVVSQLPLPSGETIGDANSVNASGVAVGSVDGGSLQQAVIYNGATATVINQTTTNGCTFVTAFGINNSGRVVGQGIDPNNAARNVGIVYEIGGVNAFEVGAVPGANGALAFAVSNTGYVVGSSMMNQGSGTPFIWSDANGIVAIPLATGTSEGSARGVNSAGWVVGDDSSAFSIPFLWDGTTTYRIADLLPAGSGWDLETNTSSSALGISDDGVIVGTGVHNGDTHAYALVPVASSPTPTPTSTPPTPTPTATVAASATPTATATATATVAPTPSPDPTPTPTPTPSPSPTPTTKSINISTRMRVETGDNVGIGGFIITGNTPKHVLIRGIGPSLVDFGITGALADPTLDLRRADGSRILANDNWRDTQQTEIEATGIPPTNDLEAAIIETLPPGSYTAILRGKGQGSGIGLVEIYDLNQGVDSKLADLSTRAFVSTGDNIVIAGLILGDNNGDDRIVVRGLGPSLTALGVPNALPNPTLELRDSDGALLVSDNDWQDDPDQATALTAAGLAPTNDLESGIAATLPPGTYTALLTGVNNGSGVGLIEVYDLGP